ncbi:MAG: cytochrome-c peroxidase [Aureispira sp.]|nr:cytochrome-c peroxidase [Aureispira sp.]
MRYYCSILIIGILCAWGSFQNNYKLDIPEGFPEPVFPEDNLLTIERVKLGKRLFYDPILSRDSTISCASCHRPELAFTDAKPKGIGIRGQEVARNSPTLVNVAYQSKGLFHDQGVPSLEMQILVPSQEVKEFDLPLLLAAERLKNDSIYRIWSQKAYGREPDPFVITRAIAAFERTLIGGNSKFDQFYYQKDSTALSISEQRGMDLFFDSLSCAKCHSGFNFTNLALENNGLYEVYADSGRMRITLKEEDRDLFKVPTLRNIALTGPYMHDGSIQTLEEVIAHYEKGGVNHKHKSHLLEPLTLSTEEKEDLLSFLRALTDYTFVQNPDFVPSEE